jgi:uncharacterized protein with FMN-binding domain
MRRAVLTLGGTIAGLAALLSFKTHPVSSGVFAAETPGTSMPAPGGPGSPAAAGGLGSAAAAAPAAPAPSTAPAAPGAPGAAAAPTANGVTAPASPAGKPSGMAGPATTRTVTGAVANTQYGPMQVQLTLVGQRITKVTVVQQTNVGAMSEQIDSAAIPKLTSETLTAQSARIDAVSGASYTSAGYIQSLQSALDKARG